MVEQTVQVQVRFTFPEDGVVPEFTDALYYDPAVYAKMSKADLAADQQARYQDWRDSLTAAQEASDVTPLPGEDQPNTQETSHRMKPVRGPGAPKVRGGAVYRCSCNRWTTIARNTKEAAKAHVGHKQAEEAAAAQEQAAVQGS